MGRKRAQETLAEVRARQIRDQTRRTEARIRQLLAPSSAEEYSAEDSEDSECRAVREERVVKGRRGRKEEARNYSWCGCLLRCLCGVVVFVVCVLVCASLLLAYLSKVSLVLHA
jgi:hypothetical protein